MNHTALTGHLPTDRQDSETFGFLFIVWPLRFRLPELGEVAEWSNVPDSKSGEPQGSVGSNPTLSATLIVKWLPNFRVLVATPSGNMTTYVADRF